MANTRARLDKCQTGKHHRRGEDGWARVHIPWEGTVDDILAESPRLPEQLVCVGGAGAGKLQQQYP